jgi:hypothetical protein
MTKNTRRKKEPWEKGWSDRHDPLAGMAAIPGEPLEVFRGGVAFLIEDQEPISAFKNLGAYHIMREDGSYVLNKQNYTNVFETTDDAKKSIYEQKQELVKRRPNRV